MRRRFHSNPGTEISSPCRYEECRFAESYLRTPSATSSRAPSDPWPKGCPQLCLAKNLARGYFAYCHDDHREFVAQPGWQAETGPLDLPDKPRRWCFPESHAGAGLRAAEPLPVQSVSLAGVPAPRSAAWLPPEAGGSHNPPPVAPPAAGMGCGARGRRLSTLAPLSTAVTPFRMAGPPVSVRVSCAWITR